MLTVALAMGKHPATVRRWDPQDVMLLAAKKRIEERDMDRRFGRLIRWIAAQGGVNLGIEQTFPSLAGEGRELVDDGSRVL